MGQTPVGGSDLFGARDMMNLNSGAERGEGLFSHRQKNFFFPFLYLRDRPKVHFLQHLLIRGLNCYPRLTVCFYDRLNFAIFSHTARVIDEA